MQDVYSSLEFKFFFLSVLFFWQHIFFIYVMKKLLQRVFSENKELSLNAAEY